MPYSLYPSTQSLRQAEGRQAPSLESLKQVEPESRRRAPPYKVFQDFQASYSTLGQTPHKAVERNASPSLGSDGAPGRHPHTVLVPSQTGTRSNSPSSPHPREPSGSVPMSPASSREMHDTPATSVTLTPLQTNGLMGDTSEFDPLQNYDPGSFDLVAPHANGSSQKQFSLETRSQQLFSHEHLHAIFSDPALLLKFTSFLSTIRPLSIPILVYYLDALKALKAIAYANAIAEGLEPIEGCDFSTSFPKPTVNPSLEEKAYKAFDALVNNDLPAYITHVYIQIVSLSISRRVTGTLAPHLREASEGLAEVFCLTDPSRPDNPIVFASEEFHKTTQYGMSYVIGSNCRFLQGPKTNPFSVRRIREAIDSGKEHCETFLNYRRDGSPFMNLLMIAPLCDSRGQIRYFIGAQVDVTGLVKDCTELESLQRVVANHRNEQDDTGDSATSAPAPKKDEFQELSEMLNVAELDTVRKHGGHMHRERQYEDDDAASIAGLHKPRLLLKEMSPVLENSYILNSREGGKLSGVYQHYLLIRPHPSLRILFASPSLRVPGILQSPFMNKIGGSNRVRDELTAALAEGRGVTAKVRWVSRTDEDGRNRWIHCTPLLGSNGQIGVWMVVLVDDGTEMHRRWKQAPPVDPYLFQKQHGDKDRQRHHGRGEYVSNGVNNPDSPRSRLDSLRSSNNGEDGLYNSSSWSSGQYNLQ